MAATVASALRWWARTKGDQCALIVGEDEISYRQLHEWTSRLARKLTDEGVKPGDRVGLLAPNTPQWPVAALAVMKSGATLVPLNSRLKPAEIRKIADDAEINAVIAASTHAAGADEARGAGRDFTLWTFDIVDDQQFGEPDDFVIQPQPDDPIAVIFTSGSTGLSKGVILTSRTLMGMVLENTLAEEGFRPGTVTLLVLPLAFTPGLVYGLLITSVLGGTLVVEPELNPARAVTLIEKYSVRALFGVPLVFEALSRAAEFAEADLSSLQTAIVGGAAVPVDLLRRWAEKGVLLRQIYGMTEAGGVATATLKDDALEHPDSCGSGSIFTEVDVMLDDGSMAGPGEPGELVVRGPGVTPGYWNDPQTTAAAIRDGWLHSGDVGVRDEQGRITFLDRIKELIISGGINISPVELESAIRTLDGVEEVAVIAAPDPRFGETPAAIVTVVDGAALDESAVVAHCEAVLSDYKVPRYIVLRTDRLPRLPSGKLDKSAIRDEYRDIPGRFNRVR
ncbi:AMP-binding protein [Mycobacterium sp. CVI_P3]|uniref:AMP-binding protein n=1 Tax=Mycobacterium pinniadriaticum TaxID=2994102 RepID=A0ABT3S9Z5_9MYCO|nr:AMP-binding protein [Mycobacterium pinniadriaticum]MCX2930019.1 AMP-binding protein [Mycobacterium pinniadriaticum]MCX2936332.1 AMP-binding protein [Mycobacterium pinniadriaticum]